MIQVYQIAPLVFLLLTVLCFDRWRRTRNKETPRIIRTSPDLGQIVAIEELNERDIMPVYFSVSGDTESSDSAYSYCAERITLDYAVMLDEMMNNRTYTFAQ